YHGETGIRMLRELARSYLTVVKDLFGVMNRLKALYRSWAIPCAGRDVYYTRHRSQWLEKIPEAGTRRRAEQLHEQLDMLQHLRQQARRELWTYSVLGLETRDSGEYHYVHGQVRRRKKQATIRGLNNCVWIGFVALGRAMWWSTQEKHVQGCKRNSQRGKHKTPGHGQPPEEAPYDKRRILWCFGTNRAVRDCTPLNI